MDLKHIKGQTYYLDGSVNTGIIVLENKDCIIIDPGIGGQRAEEQIELFKRDDLRPRAVLITHEHVDHHGACYQLKKEYKDLKFYASQRGAIYTSSPDIYYKYFTGGNYSGLVDKHIREHFIEEVEFDHILHEGKNTICGHNFYIHYTHGHSDGSISIVTADNVIFVGDLLIAEKVLDILGFMVIHDIDAHRISMEKIKSLKCSFLVNGHSRKIYKYDEIEEFVETNKVATDKFENKIIELFGKDKLRHEDILQRVIKEYNLKFEYTEYHYYKAIIQSMLASLTDRNILNFDLNEDYCLRYFVDRSQL